MKSPIAYALLSLVAGSVITGLKFTAYFMTGSLAIFSDALESIVNVVAASFALYAVREAEKEADPDHPYGRGRLEYVSAGFEGGLIAFAGALILYESVPLIISGTALRGLDFGIFLTLLAAGLNAALAGVLLVQGKRLHSMALTADGKHIMSDVVTSVAVVLGLGIVRLTGITNFDPLLASLSALWILVSGWRLITKSLGHLLDRPDKDTLDSTARVIAASRPPELINMHRFRLRESGRRIHLDFHVIVPRYLSVAALHDIQESLRSDLEKGSGRPSDLMAHYDPCGSEHCYLCEMADCKVRTEQQRVVPQWNSVELVKDLTQQVRKDLTK